MSELTEGTYCLTADTIFIQIASYRDPELLNTIRDCDKNANMPNNLVFCICWQKDDTESLEEYTNDIRMKIIPIHYKDSKGVCWARNKIQQHYNNEKYTLQLDSHHRFVKGWDTILINMYKLLKEKGYQKPLITTYLPSYDPENDPNGRVQTPWKMVFDKFIENNIVIFLPEYITNPSELIEPLPAKFYSGHFGFTTGLMCTEVPHDPNLYFIGEEINISIRAYTNGYDLFHPNCLVAWHEYTRKGRVKHWDDDKEWYKKDKSSKDFFTNFLLGKNTKFGFGLNRTLQDYQEYSGLNFLTGRLLNTNDTNNCLNNTTNNTANNTTNNTANKIICNEWKKWIKANLCLGIQPKVIYDILINAGFNNDDVIKELYKK